MQLCPRLCAVLCAILENMLFWPESLQVSCFGDDSSYLALCVIILLWLIFPMQNWPFVQILLSAVLHFRTHCFIHLRSPLCWDFQKKHPTKLTRFLHASCSRRRCPGFANSILNNMFAMLLRRKGTFAEELHYHSDLYAWIPEYDRTHASPPN